MPTHAPNETDVTAAPATAAPHPNYLYVYLSLVVLTAMELAVIFMPIGRAGIILILTTFALAKLAIVVMYYMHLKFEPRLYTWVFLAPAVCGDGRNRRVALVTRLICRVVARREASSLRCLPGPQRTVLLRASILLPGSGIMIEYRAIG
ncbi:MAG: cytochrome C oxidase subunit IV family protein [Anaerolineae bacterium]|nr:MAG: cytochrome C oxidase subunit IV family protein [Anaerolineae bacterium]